MDSEMCITRRLDGEGGLRDVDWLDQHLKAVMGISGGL